MPKSCGTSCWLRSAGSAWATAPTATSRAQSSGAPRSFPAGNDAPRAPATAGQRGTLGLILNYLALEGLRRALCEECQRARLGTLAVISSPNLRGDLIPRLLHCRSGRVPGCIDPFGTVQLAETPVPYCDRREPH